MSLGALNLGLEASHLNAVINRLCATVGKSSVFRSGPSTGNCGLANPNCHMRMLCAMKS